MNVLVTGGAASGKSAFAERLACSLSPKRTYLATMRPQGAEAQRRIAKHRAQREGLGFCTVECGASLSSLFPSGLSKNLAETTIGGQSPNGCLQPEGDCPPVVVSEFDGCKTRGGVVLLEDLGNLVANALFSDDGYMADPAKVLKRLEHEIMELSRRFDHLLVVGNEVGCEGHSPYEGTRTWVRTNGTLCCRVAARFDVVVETNAGMPCVLKGELPEGELE